MGTNEPIDRARADRDAAVARWVNLNGAKSGEALLVCDTDGDGVDQALRDVLRHAPERIGDVVLVDFTDEDWPVGLNPLDISAPERITPTLAAVAKLVSERASGDDINGPRSVMLAVQATAALAAANLAAGLDAKATLLQVPRFFQETEFRRLVMAACASHPAAESFNADSGWFEEMGDKDRSSLCMPILRAFEPVGNSRALANILGVGTNRLDVAALMDERRIVLVRLAGGDAWAPQARFLEAFLAPVFNAAQAMAGGLSHRGSVVTFGPEDDRPVDMAEASIIDGIRERSRALVCAPRAQVEELRNTWVERMRKELGSVAPAGNAAALAA